MSILANNRVGGKSDPSEDATVESPEPVAWNLRAALGLADMGFRPIPLAPAKNVPAGGLRGWQRWATADPVTIWRSFAKRPRANIGVVTGRGLFVVDLDAKHDGIRAFEALRAGRELPDTATASTPGGGRHHYFACDPDLDVRNSAGRLAPGVDIRGHHGFVAAPPSVRDGRAYEWVRHPSEGIADAPAWLLGAIDAARAKSPPKKATAATTEPTDGLVGRLVVADVPGDQAAAQDQGTAVPAVVADETGPRRSSQPTPPLTLFVPVASLMAEAIERWPVTGHGTRNDVMVRMIASFLRRRLKPELVVEVVARWHKHFHDAGLCRTHYHLARRKAQEAIEAVLRSPDFVWTPELSADDHREACKAIKLDDWQADLLVQPVSNLSKEINNQCLLMGCPPGGEETSGSPDNTSLTSNKCRLMGFVRLLCETDKEIAFVEALVVLATYQLIGLGFPTLRVTGDLILKVAADRHEGMGWHAPEAERMSRRYVDRPGKPAERFALLRQVEKGQWGRNGSPGTPSVYEPTGLRLLLPPPERAASTA